MKTKNVVLALAVGIMVCLLAVAPFIQATTPVVVTSESLVLKDASGNVIGIVGLNTTILYCTAIDQLTSGQGVKLYRLVVENGSSFPSSPVDKQFFYRYDTGLLYVYNASSWNPVGSAPTTYPYANITGVPDLSGLLAQNGSRPLLNNWNTGSYGIYGLTYVSTVGTVYCAGLSNVTLAGYVNTTRLLVETAATAPATPASGYVYFDTAQNNLFIYNGTGWMALGNASSPAAPDLTVYLFDNGTRPLTANWNTGSYGLYGMTWVNTTNLNIAGQLWWNGYNRTDIIAHPQDSFNFLVYSEGGASYARTGNTWQVSASTIQACVDAVTSSGGSIIVKNGTYSEAVSLKNATRLVLDRGCVGVTVTIASGATAILEDYNSAITWVWSGGVLVMQYNNINGLITGIYANFNQYWSGAYNRTDAVVNPYGPYSYIIDLSGTTYRMRNGTTGQVDYQSTNLTLVEQFASGNLSSGLIYLKEVAWNTSLGSPADNVMVVQQYLGEIRYISSQAKFVIPQLGSDPNTTGWTQAEQGRIWYNTGEDTMKYWNGTAIVIMPSIGGGSASSYTLPYSYTIYKTGSTYYSESASGVLSSSSNVATLVTGLYSAAGVSVFAKAGTYTQTATITIGYSNCSLVGEGIGTVFTLANSANVNVITVSGSGVKNVHVSDLCVDGNDAGNTAGTGIYVSTAYVTWDACHILSNLNIRDTDENGLEIAGDTRVVKISNVNVRYPGEHGLKLAGTDHYVDNVEVGWSGFSGIRMTCTSTKFSNVKVFAAGILNNFSDCAGWYLDGPDAACYCTFVNCVAEDCRYNGWLLENGVRDDTFSSCWAKNCAQYNHAGWDGWNITNACYRLQFSACWAYNSTTAAGLNLQYNGFGVYGGCYELVFSGCQATGNENTGLMLGNSDNCTVTGGFYNDNANYGLEETSGGDYNIILGVSTMNNDAGGIVTVGSNTKCLMSYNGGTWIPGDGTGGGVSAYPNATRGIEKYVVLTDATYTWAVDATGTILCNYTYANSYKVITDAVGNLTVGRTWKETVTVKGEYTGMSQIALSSYTILQISGSLTAKNSLNTDFIYATGKTQIDVIGGKIDGNKAGQTSDSSVIRFVTSTYCTVQYCEVTGGFRRDPVVSYARGEGIEFGGCTYCKALFNYVHETDYDNIKLRDTTVSCEVSYNTCIDSENSSNIQLAGDGTERNIISNNILMRTEGGTLPVLANIKIHYADRNLITSNVMYGTNPVSIIDTADDNAIKNNYFYQATDAQSAAIVQLTNIGTGESYDTVISDNYVYNCRKRFVQIDDGNRVQILNNHVYSEAAATSHQAVYIASGVDDTRVAYNYFYNMEDGFSNAGTGTVYKDNYPSPYLSENSVSSANTTATTFVFNHGLISTASFVWVSFNFSGWTSWTWTSTSTQITVTVTGTLPASMTCYCKCEYAP